MHLLIRHLSEYTATHVLLGVFPTFERAEEARANYLARYSDDPMSDPWREQAYQETGLRESDLVIQQIEFTAWPGAQVFVISNYHEGFGQRVRKFDSIQGSKPDTDARIGELDAEEDTFPHYALCQLVRIGELLSDAPEDQPRLW
jgi:hypothetical protein